MLASHDLDLVVLRMVCSILNLMRVLFVVNSRCDRLYLLERKGRHLDVCAAFGPESDIFKTTALDQVLPCYVEEKEYRCGLPATTLAVTSAMLLLIVAYFVLYCFFLFRAMGQLRANPNVEFKLANTIVRIQVRVHLSWVKNPRLSHCQSKSRSPFKIFFQPLEISDEHLTKLMLSMACIYCMYAWHQTGFAIAIADLDYQFVLHQFWKSYRMLSPKCAFRINVSAAELQKLIAEKAADCKAFQNDIQ